MTSLTCSVIWAGNSRSHKGQGHIKVKVKHVSRFVPLNIFYTSCSRSHKKCTYTIQLWMAPVTLTLNRGQPGWYLKIRLFCVLYTLHKWAHHFQSLSRILAICEKLLFFGLIYWSCDLDLEVRPNSHVWYLRSGLHTSFGNIWCFCPQ